MDSKAWHTGVGNMLAWHAVNPGSIVGRGIHSDSTDHCDGGSVSLDPLEPMLIKGHLQARSKE